MILSACLLVRSALSHVEEDLKTGFKTGFEPKSESQTDFTKLISLYSGSFEVH